MADMPHRKRKQTHILVNVPSTDSLSQLTQNTYKENVVSFFFSIRNFYPAENFLFFKGIFFFLNVIYQTFTQV